MAVSGPSTTPRGEHTPRPGITWDTRLVSTGEKVIYDPDDTTGQISNQPLPPRPNRATRRATRKNRNRT